MNKKILIVRAGYGGLSGTTLLGKKGFSVKIIDKNKLIAEEN
jgi:NADH dehydrogenase FAD-containing subunit